MPDLAERVLAELGDFVEPVARAMETPQEFGAFLRRLGFPFEGAQLEAALAAISPLRDGALALIDLSEKVLADGFQKTDLQALASAAKPVFAEISKIAQPLQGIVPAGMPPAAYAQALTTLPAEILSLLLSSYLSRRLPAVLHGLALLDAYRPRQIAATGEPQSRGIAYTRQEYDWRRISQIITDPDQWAREAYGWGVDLDTAKAMHRIGEALRFIGGAPWMDDMSPAQLQALAPNLAALPVPVAVFMMFVPLLQTEDEPVSAQLGIAVFPASDGPPQTEGLALGPYARGKVASEVQPTEGLTVKVEGSIGAVGGAVFQFQPGKASVKTGLDATAFQSSFGVEAVFGPATPDEKLIFLGRPDGTRVQADALVARVGGSASNAGADFHIAGGIKNLTAVIDPGEDGLLSAVISSPFTIDGGDLVIGWRFGKGIYFEGGTEIEINVPVDIELGPIRIHEFGLALGLQPPVSLTVTTSLDLTLGPLFASAEDLGLKASWVKDPDGPFNGHSIAFALRPPSGYAIALDASPIEGGGLLSVGDNEYRGALALKFATVGFSAFGILNTRMPDGRKGFSFAASIFGEFTLPLGFGFFLTGLGGVIGINRTINTDALRTVLYEGRLDNILFPADPIRNARTILNDMAAILPPREGQHVFGPVARIAWGQPVLVDVKLGLVLEVGSEIRLLILGSLGVNIPTRELATVAINVTFFGEIDFGSGTISFDATLVNSRILTFAVSGDAAVRTGWGPRIEHVVSFGGLHPQFPRPANLPDLRRLSISFGTNNPRITLTAYHAITTNSVQFGARAEAYAEGPDIWLIGQVAAKGWLFLDALIYFDPFAFDVALGGGLEILVDGDVKAGLGFDLRLRGPNRFTIDGRVWVTICGIDCGFPIHAKWGTPRTVAPPVADAVEVLRTALTDRRSIEPVAPGTRSSGVAFAEQGETDASATSPLIDPLGGVRITQKALPLGIPIQKIGEAQVAGPANTLTLGVFDHTGAALTVTPTRDEFVRGHFFVLSEAERLRATAFDTFDAGFDYGDQGLSGPVSRAIEDVYAYEFIPIPAEDDEAGWGKTSMFAKVTPDDIAGRLVRASLDPLTKPPGLRGIRIDPPRPLSVSPSLVLEEAKLATVPMHGPQDRPAARSAGAAHAGLQPAKVALDGADLQQEPNPLVRDYVVMAAA